MNRITSVDELMIERSRIESNIRHHKEEIKKGVDDLKEKFEPLLYILPILGLFKKGNSKHPLLKSAASLGIDFLVGQKLLSKSGNLMRLLIPNFLKLFSSAFFAKK